MSQNPHFLQLRLVDQRNRVIGDGRRYTLTWTDNGATSPTITEGTTDESGRTQRIRTRGAVPVSVAIAPPAGTQCRPVGRDITSKPEGRNALVSLRLAFSGTVTTAPQAQNHCETLTIRSGAQRVRYVINNVREVTNNGRRYATYLTNFPYIVVDADTLDILHTGTTANQPARFTGSRSQVATVEVPVDGVANVGIVLGAAASGDPQRWRDDAQNLVMYRVQPAAEGLTTVTINEKAEVGEPPEDDTPLTKTKEVSSEQHTGVLNGLVWRTFTRLYTMDDIRSMIPGRLTIDTPQGITTWYEIARPSERQIAWALAQNLINARQAAAYRHALQQPAPRRNAGQTANAVPPALRRPDPPAPLRVQLDWAELLRPIYEGQIDTTDFPERPSGLSRGGKIHIEPLDLTLHLQPGFSDNAEQYSGRNQAQVLAHNHPYIYMMVISACAQHQLTHVRIVGSWRPMLGSILHKLGDALDITEVDSHHDNLPLFRFDGSHVRNNSAANRFNTKLFGQRYARATQHIYAGDNHPHTADNSHRNHLHITCDSRAPLHERDQAGYQGPADSHYAPPDPPPPFTLPNWPQQTPQPLRPWRPPLR